MKSLRRMGGLLVAMIIVGTIPDTISWQPARTAYLRASPSAASTSTVDLSSVNAPAQAGTTPTAEMASVAPTAALAPSPETPLAQAQDPAQEQRDLRKQLAALAQLPASTPSPVTPTPNPISGTAVAHPTLAIDSLDLYVHLPPQAAEKQPLRLVLALHGMGGSGAKFAESLVQESDRNGWVLVAPTLPYGRDYKDPGQLMRDDIALGHTLHALIDSLPKRLGLRLRQHVMIIGFSRGAQLGHRFALFHPDHVESLALISAGSYTMPMANTSGTQKLLMFPLGIGDLPTYLGQPVDWKDLKLISFWIAVGDKDNRTGDVSRAFDSYGNTRIERARTFTSALQSIGIDAQLVVFPNVDHEVTADMRSKALDFFRKDELADHWDD